MPTNLSPEVEAEMREAATLLLVYNPEIDRLDPWKDLCSACGLGNCSSHSRGGSGGAFNVVVSILRH